MRRYKQSYVEQIKTIKIYSRTKAYMHLKVLNMFLVTNYRNLRR